MLEDVDRSEFTTSGADVAKVDRVKAPALRWPTEITPEMVSVALLKPDRMSTIDLFQYIRHLEANGQTSQRYEIEFWRKVFYPLSCMVMVVLALPFAYLHFRSGGITSYVFGGVLIGISFFLLNNVFGYIGNLQNWRPWLTAAAPGLIYSLFSLGAFGWLVLRRSMTRAVILFGHGSRDPLWRQPMEAVAARLARRRPDVPVRCAYLELEQPEPRRCRGAAGRRRRDRGHGRADVPGHRQARTGRPPGADGSAAAAHPGVRFVLQGAGRRRRARPRPAGRYRARIAAPGCGSPCEA